MCVWGGGGGGGGGGFHFQKWSQNWLVPETGVVVLFIYSQNPKLSDRAFESSTFTKIADAASCRHETPVCCLLGLDPCSLVANNQNWNRNVDPGANSLVWLIKRQILELREPALEFLTLAQETELCSVQTRSTI